MNNQLRFQQPRLTPAVKGLLISIAVVFVLQLSFHQFAGWDVERYLGFAPATFLSGEFWQVFTYPFLHGGISHILFNGLAIFFVGPELEMRWGAKKFLKYYGICAIGGALAQTLCWGAALAFFPSHAASLGEIPTIGASGALFGLFVAFAYLYGDAQVLVFFLFPMKVRNFVVLLACIEIVSAVFYSDQGVGHLFHLGGLVTGLLYLHFRGKDLDGRGGGGFFRRKRVMDREEVRRRLSLIVNRDEKSESGDKKFPITWN